MERLTEFIRHVGCYKPGTPEGVPRLARLKYPISTESSPNNLQLRRQQLVRARAWADHDLECSRFYHPAHIFIEERELVGRDNELHCRCLSRLEVNAPEIFEFFDGASERTD